MSAERLSITKLKIAHSLSQETTAYTAVIRLDNRPVLHASNHGSGGSDLYQKHDSATHEDVATLKRYARDTLLANPPASLIGMYGDRDAALKALNRNSDDSALEILIHERIAAIEATLTVARLCKQNIVIREDGAIYTMKGAYTPERAASILERYPSAEILNPEHQKA